MIVAIVVGVASAVATLVLAGAGSGVGREARPRASPPFSLEDARAFGAYELYFAGDRIEGLPLTAVLHRTGSADFVSFVYGDCMPDDDSGCAPPVEVQVWPACRRHLALYGAFTPSERVTIRGVPAAVADGGTRLELHTGRSTVVVFAESRARAERVVGALRALDTTSARSVSLPPPNPGALEGELRC